MTPSSSVVTDTTSVATEAHNTGKAEIYIPSLYPKQVGDVAGVPITDTLLMSWVVMGVLIAIAFFVGRSIKMIPGKTQLVFESIIDSVYGYMADTLENRTLARRYLPLVVTLFLFIAFANVLVFLPGFGSIGIWQDGKLVHLFRSMNTDLNTTLALAIIAFVSIEVAGVRHLGLFTYIGKFINFKSPLKFVVGIIELASELIRLISFSFRLYGNIIAGKILLAVVAFFVPYVLPGAIIGFEMFIGIIQATIFALLTLFFIKLAVAKPH